MEIVAKVSKGTVMDQIYLPKKRAGFPIGKHVLVSSLESKKSTQKPYFYHVKQVSPIKLSIIEEIFTIIDSYVEKYDNIIITGSFLDHGFTFNDIDILLITEEKVLSLQKILEDTFKVKIQLLVLDYKSLLVGLSTDPLYQSMLSRFASKKRVIYKIHHKPLFKLLDLHLLNSKTLLDGFEVLTGKEKYALTRNLVAIFLFLKEIRVTQLLIDQEIKKLFNVSPQDIKNNIVSRLPFIKLYKKIYGQTFERIMEGVSNESKQK